MKRFTLCFGLWCIVCMADAQTASARDEWVKYFGTTSKTETAYDICRVNSYEHSDYVTVGYQKSGPGQYSAYISRIGRNGTQGYTTTYRGPNNNQNCFAYSVMRYTDYHGTYVVVTGKIQNMGQWDLFAVTYKLRTNDFLKVRENPCVGKVRGDSDSKFKVGYDIIPYSYNSFAITGQTNEGEMCLLRLYRNLNLAEEYIHNGSQTDKSTGYSLCKKYSYLYVCGSATTNGEDKKLQLLWTKFDLSAGFFSLTDEKYFGGDYNDVGYSITTGPSNGDTTIVGKYGQTPNNSDYWFMTINDDGGNQTDKKWGDPNLNEELMSIEKIQYSNFIVAGRVDIDSSPSIQYYTYLSKRNHYGNEHWEQQFGHSSQITGSGFVKITPPSYDYFAVATSAFPGTGSGDVYVIKYRD